jgi:Helix-turn-helix.
LKKGSRILIHTIFSLYILPDNGTVGQKIRYYRLKRHMFIDFLSSKTGTSRHAIMDYEKDRTEPELEVLKSIANTLKINPVELYDEYYQFLDYPYYALVKEVRRKMYLTQKQFGAYFGVGRRTVERWEAGRNKVTREVFEQMKMLKLL